MKHLIWFLLGLAGFATSAANAQVDTGWVRRYDGPTHQQDHGTSIEVDSDGNVYVCGGLGTQTHDTYGLIKYDSDGQMQWQRSINGIVVHLYHLKTMCMSRLGDIYFTGFGGINSDNIYTVKYTSDGDSSWSRLYSCTIYGGPQALICDILGNVYIAGNKPVNSIRAYLILKYNRQGNLVWSANYYDPGDRSGYSSGIGVDMTGNVVITGRYDADIVTLKYNQSGGLLWSASIESAGFINSINPIAVDLEGNAAVCGYAARDGAIEPMLAKYYSNGDTAWIRYLPVQVDISSSYIAVAMDKSGYVYASGYYTERINNNEETDFLTVKYGPGGDTCWVRRYSRVPWVVDIACDIAVDMNGAVYVAGTTFSTLTEYDYCVVKYTPNGEFEWAGRYDGPGHNNEMLIDLAVDDIGNAYVTGGSTGSTLDYATVKFMSVESGVDIQPVVLPASATLLQNYPNPFNAQTTISYSLPAASDLSIDIFDINGRKIETVISENQEAGEHQIVWNSGDRASGVYFYRLRMGEKEVTNTMVLLK